MKRYVGALFLIANTAMAVEVDNDSMGVVKEIETGRKCGEISAYLEKIDQGKESLQLQFYELALNHEGIGAESVDCSIEAKIMVPAGKRFSANSAALYGAYDVGYDARASASLSYEVDLTNQDTDWEQDFEAGDYGDFSLIAEIEDPRFSSCSDQDQILTLRTDIRLFAYHKEYSSSLLEVDAADQNYSLSWDWRWESCETNYFNKPFVSYYKAYNSRNYQATVEMNGSRGSFESSAGFKGRLYDIRYEDGGLVAKGRWKASGSSGWFEFRMLDKKTGRFEGEWGDDKKGEIGPWRGEFK